MGTLAASPTGARRRFCLVLVKPSHYDDDGYVIQWFRSPIPSNSLASLYGLAKDCAERHVLGDDVEIDIHAFDETNSRVRPGGWRAMIEAAGAGMVMLVGVQSNQFPRALDLARPLRERGIQVGIGGFHVSGVLSHARRRRRRSRPRQGDGRLAVRRRGRRPARRRAARRASRGTLKPLYNFMDDLPNIEGTPIPLMAAERVQRTAGRRDQLRRRPRLSRTSARSAPSSTCRAASRAAARRTTSRRSCASISRKGCAASSSPTTISRATRTGRQSSIG